MIALLDYDGYVCKAFYAAQSKDLNEIEDMEEILNHLVDSVKDKADYNSELKIIKVMSGHTFKKDVYPSYKADRKKNEDLGMFRDYIKLADPDIIIVPNLEADDVITMMYDYYKSYDNVKVFSDDKDLRYYNPHYCKINLTEVPQFEADASTERYEQMLAGDKEDGISGIPKVGMVTAKKLLDMYGYTLEHVIEIYRDKEVSIDDCMRDLMLVTPICRLWTENYQYGFDEQTVMNNIIGRFKYFNRAIKEIYNDKKN